MPPQTPPSDPLYPLFLMITAFAHAGEDQLSGTSNMLWTPSGERSHRRVGLRLVAQTMVGGSCGGQEPNSSVT